VCSSDLVILLFAEKKGESCDSLGAFFENSPRSISNWIKRVNMTGDIQSLWSKPTFGRPPRLSKAQRDEIKLVLRESPEKQGMDVKRWSGSSLSSYISRHYGISLKVRACQRLFRKLCPVDRK
jgi:transposase